jgi:glycosyltransferase involved in cell wall biosynthesis
MSQSNDTAAHTNGHATKTPTLSVTLLNYNYGRYLKGCLDSILSQTFGDFELIIIDDRSPDDSLEVIKPYLADPRVRLVAHTKNVGYGGSLVEGTSECSRGEFVMVISADDLVRRPDAFERQIAKLRENPNAAFCFSAYNSFHDDGKIVEHQRSYEGDRVLNGSDFFRDYATRQAVQVLHTGTMLRKSKYFAAGGYRRDLNICLDFAMWLVLCQEGDVAYIDDELYGYRTHPGQMSQSLKKAHANVKECLSAIEVACQRAREKGLRIADLREEAIQYILFAITIADAFNDRSKLALARSASALLLQPRLTLTAPGLRVVLARLALGGDRYQRALSWVRARNGGSSRTL